jgi:hypothetical protein
MEPLNEDERGWDEADEYRCERDDFDDEVDTPDDYEEVQTP